MSVESEILRIQKNIADAYAVVAEKGGEVPLHPTSANLAAAVASIPDASIPTGGIIIWSGSTVPDGWALCDGTNGTPDLRGRFVLGSSDSHAIGSMGGSEEVTLTVAQMPSHNHTYYNVPNIIYKVGQGSYNSNVHVSETSNKTSYTGGSQPHPNMPPYYTLAYIMKL